jgi:chemotaxis signal transduction protein
VLVLDRGDGVGLRVDEVEDVVRVPPDRVESDEAMDELVAAGVSRGLVKRVVVLETDAGPEPIAWLDVDALVDRAAG